jgi:hypothetical protein
VDEPLGGLGEADALLGRPFPLPSLPLPLARWVDVRAVGDGAEVVWSLDDSRDGVPGRLALYAGASPAPVRDVAWEGPARHVGVPGAGEVALRGAPLDEAQASLRPVQELCWTRDGLHLRLTAQGPWALVELAAIAGSIVP